ncbi:hypothetical protein BH09ACT8_BH09ACT8_27250 [soil metagenome]
MSLLNRGTETVKVYQETQVPDIDSDGNEITRASLVPYEARAVVQPITAVGANTENMDGGFNTTAKYRLRLINYPVILGAQSQIEWNGKRYSILGDAIIHNGSPRTRHVVYTMVRK